MRKFLSLFILVLVVAFVVGCNPKPTTQTTNTTGTTGTSGTTGTTGTTQVRTAPVIAGVADTQVTVGNPFDPMAGVTATDEVDGDLTDDINVTGTVDVDTVGSYTLTYTVTNSGNKTTTEERVVEVIQIDLTQANGTYSFRFADSDLRHTFFAAAEKYLLNNMYAGVPVFANAGFALYSSRLQLPVQESVPVMGFGTMYATMSLDDSTVLMDDGALGNKGEYTYRAALAQNPTTFQHWLYDDSTSADVIGMFLDSLYTYKFNEDKTGYAVVPSMASDYPQPQNPEPINGKEAATTWRIPVRNDLVWTYHPNTDTSSFPAGHEIIDANDFVDTFKYALEQEWFRAISGGGDFLNAATEIKGARDFVDGEVAWDQVGIKLVDNNTFELEFVNPQSEWSVRYFLSSWVLTPVNFDLYNTLWNTDHTVNSYGTTPETTAYNGPFYMDYYEADSIVRYVKNPNFHDKDEIFFTHYTYAVIEDAEVRFQEFIGGKLESAALPTAKYENFKNHPGLKRLPGATTFRIMINGLGTVENQRAQFPDGTWVPEPILANQNFKKAMYFAIDRKTLAYDVLKTSESQMYLFTDAYLVDAETGVPFRNTPQAGTVSEGLSPTTDGYNADLAAAYWRSAIDALVADGTYTPGTADNWTVINMNLRIFSGSQAQALFGEFIKDSFESIFIDEQRHIKVEITPEPTEFPSIYYDYMMVGEFDLSVGGISGSTLDAASFLDTYCSDNRGGFTLNWGIDTSTADIEVIYTDPATNQLVRQMWSFDAITAALNGSVTVENGVEVIDEVTAE